MPKPLGKYFLALVPQGEVFEKSEHIKTELQDRFNLKYARRSPSHITLKMPFTYNEAKEDKLISKLCAFSSARQSFPVQVNGIGRFGSRVIFVKVRPSPPLLEVQQELSQFCKTGLKLDQELSDRNFTPHMTVAFKDLKKGRFWEYFGVAKELAFSGEFLADGLTLLKREGGRWVNIEKCAFRHY
jgi:2'-5' RNA ligase